MFYHPAAFFLFLDIDSDGVSCETPSESIYGTELLFDNSMLSVWLRSTKPILDVCPKGSRPAKSLHTNLFEIKPVNVTEGSVIPQQRR